MGVREEAQHWTDGGKTGAEDIGIATEKPKKHTKTTEKSNTEEKKKTGAIEQKINTMQMNTTKKQTKETKANTGNIKQLQAKRTARGMPQIKKARSRRGRRRWKLDVARMRNRPTTVVGNENEVQR